MKRNLTSRFRRIATPNLLLESIDAETELLQRDYPHIHKFSIFVDKPQLKHHRGNLVRAQVTIAFPKKRITISKEADGMMEQDNAFLALRLAFDKARSMLEHHFDRSRHAENLPRIALASTEGRMSSFEMHRGYIGNTGDPL